MGAVALSVSTAGEKYSDNLRVVAVEGQLFYWSL